MSGVMACTGFPDGPPMKAGPALADFLAGTHLFGAIMVALYTRSLTGRGQHVSVAMHDAVLPTLASNLSGLLDFGGAVPARTGNRHGGQAVAPYNVYEAADGWVAIIAMSDRHWGGLCTVIGRPELAEDRELLHAQDRVRNIARVDELLSEWTRRLPKWDVFAACREAGIPCAPVVELAELLDDPQIRAQGMLRTAPNARGAPAFAFGNPLRFGDTPADADAGPPSPAPALGSDSEAILREWLGLSDDELAGLRQRGTI
jgi:crotonobetainyl-CoA:carnitine CoA-transferase CaiB-like acyl-CoA transferase